MLFCSRWATALSLCLGAAAWLFEDAVSDCTRMSGDTKSAVAVSVLTQILQSPCTALPPPDNRCAGEMFFVLLKMPNQSSWSRDLALQNGLLCFSSIHRLSFQNLFSPQVFLLNHLRELLCCCRCSVCLIRLHLSFPPLPLGSMHSLWVFSWCMLLLEKLMLTDCLGIAVWSVSLRELLCHFCWFLNLN